MRLGQFGFPVANRDHFSRSGKVFTLPARTNQMKGPSLFEKTNVLLPGVYLIRRATNEFGEFVMFSADAAPDEPSLETMPVFHGNQVSVPIIHPHVSKIKNMPPDETIGQQLTVADRAPGHS